MEETCKILIHVGCLREKCLYTTVQYFICPRRVVPHILSSPVLDFQLWSMQGRVSIASSELMSPWEYLGVLLSRCLDAALLNAWHLGALATNVSASAGAIRLYIHIHRQLISVPVCWWWRFWGLCIQRKAEENGNVISGVLSGSGTISMLLIPSKEDIPSSKEEKETTIIHRYVSLAYFLA